jgi:hypothetical protein
MLVETDNIKRLLRLAQRPSQKRTLKDLKTHMDKESIAIDHKTNFWRTHRDNVNCGLLHGLRGLSCMVLMVLVVGLHVNQALAQVDQGAISGVVEDSSGAIVVGARVTLTDADTGLTQETTSNKSGIYTFSPFKIGKYSVSAAAAGFKTTVQPRSGRCNNHSDKPIACASG